MRPLHSRIYAVITNTINNNITPEQILALRIIADGETTYNIEYFPFSRQGIFTRLLGSVDLYRLNFVQSKSILIAASEMWASHLSEFHSTKSKTL